MKGFNLFPTSMSFRVPLLIYVVVPLITTVGLFGYLSLNSIEKQVEKQMQKDLELVARAVQLPLSYALEKERMGSIQQALESVFAIGRVYSAYVYNKKGKEIVRLGQAEPEPERDRLIQLAADGERRGEYGRIADRQVFSYFVPLTDTGGQINGLLQLTRKKSEFSENLQSIRIKGALILGVLLVLLSVVVLYGHHRALGIHLGRLNSTMFRIAQGKRKHRFNFRGPKEISIIGETFNQMLNSIDDAERTIMEHRKNHDKLEKELRQTEKLAALGRLAAGTAHELGTPLSVISGRAQRALRDKGLPDGQRQALTCIREEVVRMEHIIKQLLNFSRRNPLRCTPADPSHLAASAVSTVEEEAGTNGIRINFTGPENQAPIMLDTMRVQQALINLLRNAIQCVPAGKVRLTWKQDDQGVLFCVDDDGPGVLPENRSKIFEPFYTTKSVGEGTGLGLSVVHAVAEAHGGKIEVCNSEMGGASFQFLVPPQSNDHREDEQWPKPIRQAD
ncbi:MAG: HAMP domain-containing sensor histidine kinase [Desulfobacterales bacterium]